MAKTTENELLSYKGNFFFPDYPEDLVSGTLTIQSDGTSYLDLLGAFKIDGFLATRKLQTIWGVLFSGDKVSLIGSYRGKSVYRSAGSEVSYQVGTTMIGTHVQDRDQAVFTVISAEIDLLQDWLGIDGGNLSFTSDFKQTTYSYQQPVDIDFKIDNRLSGTIYFRNEFWQGREYGNEFRQRVRLELESTDLRTANELINAFLSFRHLLSIFVCQQVDIRQIVMTAPNEKRELINPTPGKGLPQKEILVYFKPGQKFTPLLDRLVPFVRYRDIAPDFQQIVYRWYQLLATELRPIIFILLDALTDHSTFEEADFLRAWRGVEAFHWLILQDTTRLKNGFQSKNGYD
jgi:hypothetical protein